jgi:hypothetical protein
MSLFQVYKWTLWHTEVSLAISPHNQRKMQYSIATRLQISLRDDLKCIRSKCDERATCNNHISLNWPYHTGPFVLFRMILKTKSYCLPQQNNERMTVLIETRCVPCKAGTEFLNVCTNFRLQRVSKQWGMTSLQHCCRDNWSKVTDVSTDHNSSLLARYDPDNTAKFRHVPRP